ncbi:flagellin [Stenotrophomonas sp. LM091]|jgi:flagellin|uniref:flagellin n=1 Tax=Stenotrophomonas sp. LM091 TaxID=1904944 RepID=UPI00089E010A|nr:flagellin [Stenotrophomonas sp. LM091]AOX64050.1 flagellin [Stenotrophomonas sp. LM091]
MAQVINTNTMSLNAQRNLSTSGSSLATTIQRLSSGSRINSAKDDAAGLAISERFGTQIRGTDVAIRNANDGISLAQVAEGSLSEIGNNLQRVRELAVQSSNATNSASDRKALQAEVTQLVSEIDRVAKQSEFNGTKLLDGSFSSQLFQVGANAGQAIAIDKVVDAKASSLGSTTFATAGSIDLTGDASLASGKIADAKIGAIALGEIKFDVVTAADDTDTVAVAAALATTTENAVKAISTAINAKIGETGVHAAAATKADGTVDPGKVTLTAVKADIVVADLKVSGVTADDDKTTQLTEGSAASHLSNLDIGTVVGAQQALEIVDSALSSINNTRADLGAIQNRFTSVVANLQTSTENLSASRSRIKDTDFAKETAELTRTQILQQAGTAMLAQANQVPQNVLSLLR